MLPVKRPRDATVPPTPSKKKPTTAACRRAISNFAAMATATFAKHDRAQDCSGCARATDGSLLGVCRQHHLFRDNNNNNNNSINSSKSRAAKCSLSVLARFDGGGRRRRQVYDSDDHDVQRGEMQALKLARMHCD
jgi:hypothetical protein